MTELRVVPPKRLEPPFDITTPAPTPGSDEALSVAGARLDALSAFWNGQNSPPDNAYSDEQQSLQEFVGKTPAVGVEGARVKFKLLLTFADLDLEPYGLVRDLTRTITEALERLARD